MLCFMTKINETMGDWIVAEDDIDDFGEGVSTFASSLTFRVASLQGGLGAKSNQFRKMDKNGLWHE